MNDAKEVYGVLSTIENQIIWSEKRDWFCTHKATISNIQEMEKLPCPHTMLDENSLVCRSCGMRFKIKYEPVITSDPP